MALNESDPRPLPPTLQDWTTTVLRPVVIGGMLTCVVTAWVLAFQRLVPAWNGTYLSALAALVTFETLWAEHRLRALGLARENKVQIRLVELALLLLLVKLATYIPRGPAALFSDAREWTVHPFQFIDIEFLLAGATLAAVWGIALRMADYLKEMDDAPGQERALALDALRGDFVAGAFLLLFAVGLPHAATSMELVRIHLNPPGVETWLPLAYIVLGLVLFAQARLALLLALWRHEQVETDPRLRRRWSSWGLALLIAVTGVALLLPAGDTVMGFYVFAWLLYALAIVGQLLFFVLSFVLFALLSPCAALLNAQQSAQALPPQLPPLPEPPPVSSGPGLEFLFLRQVLFWIAVVLLLFLLARAYWNDRRALGGVGFTRHLLTWYMALFTWVRGWWARLHLPAHTLPPVPPLFVAPHRWSVRAPARTGSERVRRLYLTFLDRAAQAGHARRPAQTPSEYAQTLEPALPEEHESVEALTSAFIEARYARAEFAPGRVRWLYRLYRRAVQALRGRIGGRREN